MGFMQDLGTCSILEAELWSILLGLRLGQQMGYHKIEINSDSIMAVEAVNDVVKLCGNCSNLVFSIQ